MRDPSSRVAVTKLFYRRDIPASELAKERPGYALDIAIPINQADGERERERSSPARANGGEKKRRVGDPLSARLHQDPPDRGSGRPRRRPTDADAHYRAEAVVCTRTLASPDRSCA